MTKEQEFCVYGDRLHTDVDTETPMSTLERVDMSIRKWKAIVAYYESGEEKEPIWCGGDQTCALCWGFGRYLCAGCPISEFTGEASCKETPYYTHYEVGNKIGDIKRALKAAKQEVAFLKKVRARVLKQMEEEQC